MKFEKDGENLIIKIPLYQTGDKTYGTGEWKAQNFIFVKTLNNKSNEWDYTLSNAIYLDYKDDLQEGMPIVNLEEDEFEEAMKLSGFGIFAIHTSCKSCGKVIYGSHTIDDEGDSICFSCKKSY